MAKPSIWQRIKAWLNAPVVEIDGCKNCDYAHWFRDGSGHCGAFRSSAMTMAGGWITEIMPYRAVECKSWARKVRGES